MSKTSLTWWRLPEGKAHALAWEVYEGCKIDDGTRLAQVRLWLQMYGGTPLSGLEPGSYRRAFSSDKLTFNLIKWLTDSVTAACTRTRISTRFLATGGNASNRTRAKLLTRYVDGHMRRQGGHDVMDMALLDAVVTGTGHVAPVKVGKCVQLERVAPGEIFVPQLESRDAKPRSMYRRRWVDRNYLMSRYPEKAKEILKAIGPSQSEGLLTKADHVDQVELLEAYHLPSSEEAEDGRYVCCVSTCTLIDEEWEYDDFPLVTIRYNRPLLGYWGQGIAENQIAAQIEINRTLIKIQKIHHLFSTPRVWVEQGSKVKKNSIGNAVAEVNTFSGTKPYFEPAPSVGSEFYAHVQSTIERAAQQEGISAALAGGTLPNGATSAPGIRETVDVQQGKLIHVHRSFEAAHVQVAKWLVRLSKELSEEYPDFGVVAPKDRNTIHRVAWKEIDIPEDEVDIEAFPVSSFAASPGARKADVIDLLQNGLIPPNTAMKLLDFPDLDREMSLARAQEDAIEQQIEEILDNGHPIVVEPFQDPQLAMRMAQAEYNRAVSYKVPEDRLMLLRNYMVSCRNMIKEATAEQADLAAQAAAGAPPPTGFNGAPPTADIPGNDPGLQ